MLQESKLLDDIGLALLSILQENARISFAELARRFDMSAPAIAERVRSLEDAGVITGYRAEVNRAALGLPLTVFIRLQMPPSSYAKFLQAARKMEEVLELHHVTGAEAFILKAAASSVEHLEAMLGRLSVFGQTETSLALSTPVGRRNLSPHRGGRIGNH